MPAERHVKAVCDGVVFDTAASRFLCEIQCNADADHEEWFEASLYVTGNGEFFAVLWAGCPPRRVLSMDRAVKVGPYRIIPDDRDSVEYFLSVQEEFDLYRECFGEPIPPEPEYKGVYITLPKDLMATVREKAHQEVKTLNSYVTDLLGDL